MAVVTGVAGMLTAFPVLGAELVMLEQPGCVWCKRFNDEVAPQYAKTEEGRKQNRRVEVQIEANQQLKQQSAGTT